MASIHRGIWSASLSNSQKKTVLPFFSCNVTLRNMILIERILELVHPVSVIWERQIPRGMGDRHVAGTFLDWGGGG